jgi:hypothetical protein
MAPGDDAVEHSIPQHDAEVQVGNLGEGDASGGELGGDDVVVAAGGLLLGTLAIAQMGMSGGMG